LKLGRPRSPAPPAAPGTSAAGDARGAARELGPRERPVQGDRLEPSRPRTPGVSGAVPVVAGKPPAAQATRRRSRAVGPEALAEVGDRVRGPRIGLSAAEVIDASRELSLRAAADPSLLSRLRRAPFPDDDRAAQLDWALAYAPHVERLRDPLWTVAGDDAASALVSYVRGVLAARRAGVVVTAELDAQVAQAQLALYQHIAEDPAIYGQLDTAPYPAGAADGASGGLAAKLEWAIGVLVASWDPAAHPVVKSNAEARAMIDLAAGVLTKRANDETEVVVRSARRTLEVDGDTRVYAVHTPPGPRPAEGWPTVLFFHGSYGGYAPEQSADYQALNAHADAHGYQIVYPVGSPQDRADLLRTGRGMLNWDPVGAGPGGVNDRFVHALLKAVDVDPTRVFAAGHSQGGFYVSNLIASYPRTFAGAAILGAGAGSVAAMTNHGALSRKTPVYLRTGEQDIHRPMADDLANKLDAAGWGAALRVESPPLRGHEVLSEDLAATLAFFDAQIPLTDSDAGKIDGSTSEIPPGVLPFLPSIDLVDPPASLEADPVALATMKLLASHPLIDVDGTGERLTADGWRLALYYLDSFPEEQRAAIAALRTHFVVTPPPADLVLDLAALPPALEGSAEVQAALRYFARTPALDLDGYPSVVSERELAAAEKYAAQLPAEVRAGVLAIREHVGAPAAA
jgi:polyhydroxybutyrate depolymerase